ncbi:hypothetical protein N7466_009940 [Penicillium verhagenii]|uniref:uncharacterized protein n=1 Tax=Penicillium verhagenii TaxID=1562060 RepID=UPI002545B67D|nr:uncharacterized protein N7466_009940 [Penicillium verhagenii]KAJ5918997.1 hypothetical protein N7466_009940 [Penicillium verhagenii]
MLHRSALEDEPRSFHPRRPSGSLMEPPSATPPNRPASRTSHPGSRNRIGKGSRAVTPTGLGVVTENSPGLAADGSWGSPIKEGLGSVNRWSQSTTSSKGLPDYTGHRRGSSKMSMSGHSPQRGPILGELPELGLPDLKASDMFSPDSNSHLDLSFTTSSHLFHDSSPNEQYNHRLGPSYSQGHVARPSEGNISLADVDADAEGRQHGQTQKAMLSKALQKANTAVLLDNAANFEGAMEAYTDACHLLQLVMLRSNGGDEEKLKLQEIVRKLSPWSNQLQRMDLPLPDSDGKALPDRPLSQESYGELFQPPMIDEPHIESQHSSNHSSLGFETSMEDVKQFPSESPLLVANL